MFKTQVTGGDKIAKMLDKLGKAEQREFKKEAKKGVRAEGKPVLATAKAGTPKVSGRLRKATKLRAWKRPNPGEVGVKVFIDPGASRDDPKGAFYGGMVESGYIANGQYVPGRHMLASAYRKHQKSAAKGIAQRLSRAADKIIKGS